ncbi:PA2169 family four-helix-bundle protein [Hymenobacter defluvii]|uniref:PA2169 family four-helix-bundle protein n=1 Tax=Hymenobacter defluvii TaxID=2054411 RepID=UPI001AAFBE91|nr:PA2169 family four-helix-bundle protein [Hymenobacter defluvii]
MHSPATPPRLSGPPLSSANPTSPSDAAPDPLNGSSLAYLLDQLPKSVKETALKAVSRYQQFSTTQKVVGGVVLLLAIRRLTRGDESPKKGRKKVQKAEISTLHELLHFVNDRVEGYKKAVEESQDPQRRDFYQGLVGQSEQFAQTLNEHLRHLGGGHETSTTLKGKLYRRFMAAAAVFTGHDEQTVLASNIHGEQWALAAYKDALDDETLRGPIRHEVERQYHQSQKTYQELKRMAT